MPSPRYQQRRRDRRQDVIKVRIEDVNLNAPIGPIAQGRDLKDKGLFDIDLTHSVGSAFPTPAVGEDWWIKRGGRMWVLDRIVSSTRTPPHGGGGGDGSDDNRAGVPANVNIFFTVREKKKDLEYNAAVTFDAVDTDENGDPQETSHYIIDWVPCTKIGNIIADENVRQLVWDPNDPEIDDPLDPAADYYVILPGNVPRPKVWYWKARVRAVSDGNHKGAWSDWCDPSLPIRDSLPEPPYPDDVDLIFRWKDTQQQPIFSAVVRFDDVNYWDIPGFDYEDDVSEYEIQLEPLERNDSTGAIDLTGPDDTAANGAYTDGHKYDRADPNNDGTPWEIRRHKVKDKDADDTWSPLGTLGEDISEIDTFFTVTEDGVNDPSTTPFIVLTGSGEKWLVTGRTLVSGTTYTYEVYRQFGYTSDSTHSTGANLEWLKDPFRYKVDFHHIERPRTVYWRTRVRSKDRFNRLGEWSPYTAPETPWSNIDFTVPVPLHLRGDIQIMEYKTHPEFKLVARFEDPAPNGWNIPGGDLQDDLDHYVVVAEAVLPDPDGYIEAPPPAWDSGVTYRVNDVVANGGGRWRSLQSANLGNTPVQGAFWDQTTDNAMFLIPDRRIGVLQSEVNQADTSMTVTLDADLPNSILRLLEDPDKQATYLRILTVGTPSPQFPEEGGVSEVVATTDLTSSSGSDRTYAIERMQKGSQNYGHDAGDVVYVLTEHLRRHMVDDKDKDDPGKFHKWYTVDMGRIAQPKRYYWRLRARSVDNLGHKSLWTDWTNPINPSTDPDLIVPFPEDVSLSFDRVHRDRHVRYRAIVEWHEVDYNAPDGDRENDVTRYGVQLAASDGDAINGSLNNSTTTILVDEKRNNQSPADLPFFILVDDEIMEVTDRVGIGENLEIAEQYFFEDWDVSTPVGELSNSHAETVASTPTTYVSNRFTYTVVRAQHESAADSHSDGAHVFVLPFDHHTMSAKADDDKNHYDHVAFAKAHKNFWYKARARTYDRYNRHSDWSPWTLEGTPSDIERPPKPIAVVLDVDNHKVAITWDIPVDPTDGDTDENGKIPGTDVAYFQVQLDNNANFGSLMRFDRFVQAMSKTWRVKKPGHGTYYVRVRSVDGAGNKSAWVGVSGAMNGVPTPDAPTITFDTNEETKKLRALVLLENGVTGIDDDVNGYEFELQPAKFKRLTSAVRLNQHHFYVSNDNGVPDQPFVAYVQKEEVKVIDIAHSGALWTVVRAWENTTKTTHRKRTKVQYFKASDDKRRQKTGEESEAGDPVLAIFGNIQKGLWYRARVRAHNTKGVWSNWSEWS